MQKSYILVISCNSTLVNNVIWHEAKFSGPHLHSFTNEQLLQRTPKLVIFPKM